MMIYFDGSVVKNLLGNAEDKESPVQSLGWENPLEKEMATHFSILSWEIPWTEEPSGLWGCKFHVHGVAKVWTRLCTPADPCLSYIIWLYSADWVENKIMKTDLRIVNLWSSTWLNYWRLCMKDNSINFTSLVCDMEKAMATHSMTEWLHFHFSLSCIGEGNGNPLQCSCLENPTDGGAWWAAIYGVEQSRTRLMWLSSSTAVCDISVQVDSFLPAYEKVSLETKTASLL